MSSARAVSDTFQSNARNFASRKARSACALNSSNVAHSAREPIPAPSSAGRRPASRSTSVNGDRRAGTPESGAARSCSGARARCRAIPVPPAPRPRRERSPAAPTPSRSADRRRKCCTSSGMSSRRSRSGGTAKRHDVEAVVEVLAEPARRDLGVQRLVGRGQHPHVDRDGLRAADPRHHAVLQHAQHLGLRRGAHVAHLIEEQRAAVGLLELAGAVADGPRERSAHVPEQLALDQLTRNRGAVHLDEGLVAPRRLPMDGARDELLAGAVLSRDEHARRRRRHLARSCRSARG